MAGRASRAQGHQSIKVFSVVDRDPFDGNFYDYLEVRDRKVGTDEKGRIIKALLRLEQDYSEFDNVRREIFKFFHRHSLYWTWAKLVGVSQS